MYLHAMAGGDELLLPEVLIFQEAHVPDGTPKSALRIDGYQDPVTEVEFWQVLRSNVA